MDPNHAGSAHSDKSIKENTNEEQHTRPLAMASPSWYSGPPGTARAEFLAGGRVSLFAGGRLSGWKAYLLPLVLMLVTDRLWAAIRSRLRSCMRAS